MPTRPPLAAALAAAALAAVAALALPPRAAAQTAGRDFAPGALPLWPAGAAGALGDSTADRPTITPYPAPADRATGTAVVVFPGGGYQHLAMDHEGAQVARWLNSLGVAAFVVQYRLGPRYHHPAMLHDAARAVRTVRARAAEWRVDPRRIGVLGFSAGGHLASTIATHFDTGTPTSPDPVERASSHPDFAVLVYPVITMDERLTHRGSRLNLLGDRPSAELARLLSNERQVTRDTPPTFIVASTDDATVPVENALLFYQALKADSVPVELHVFESGRHGFGLGGSDPALASWPAQCALWMRRHGWLGR